MSVIRFSKDEVADIYQELETAPRTSEFAFINSGEDWYKIKEYYKGDEDEYWKSKLGHFLQRAFIANQIAYILQYRHHDDINMKIEVMESEDFDKGHMIGRREALSRLQSLSYNLYTNDGNSCVSEPDEKLLSNIVHRIQGQNSDEYYRGIDKAIEKSKVAQEIKTS